jgi:hypothetical protein
LGQIVLFLWEKALNDLLAMVDSIGRRSPQKSHSKERNKQCSREGWNAEFIFNSNVLLCSTKIREFWPNFVFHKD